MGTMGPGFDKGVLPQRTIFYCSGSFLWDAVYRAGGKRDRSVNRAHDRDQAQQQIGQKENQKPSHLCPYAEQGDDPACQCDCLQDVVHTKLPFVCQTFGDKVDRLDMEDWELTYVDQSRIVGLKVSENFVIGVRDNGLKTILFSSGRRDRCVICWVTSGLLGPLAINWAGVLSPSPQNLVFFAFSLAGPTTSSTLLQLS